VRRLRPTRFKKANANATASSIERTIESTYGFPAGSVKLIRPDGRKLRSDATMAGLRAQWA
jgi:hypothetical protein